MTVKEHASKYSGALKVLLIVAVLITAFFLGKYVGDMLRPPDIVTGTSQNKAETVQGVHQASQDAKVHLDTSQAKEIVTQIREIRTTEKEPVYIVQTTGKDVKTESEKAVADNKADFAIVTDPNRPDEEVKLDGFDKDAKVELNQYNIQAYKPVIRQIEVGKGENGHNMVGFTVNKKISKDGQYLGIGVEHVWKGSENINMVKVVYSW